MKFLGYLFLALLCACSSVATQKQSALPDRKSWEQTNWPPLSWTDFYETERSADIPDAVRSFIIAVQVCHYFTEFDRHGLNVAQNAYADAYVDVNVDENCRIKNQNEAKLKQQYADDQFVANAIAEVLANPGRPDGD